MKEVGEFKQSEGGLTYVAVLHGRSFFLKRTSFMDSPAHVIQVSCFSGAAGEFCLGGACEVIDRPAAKFDAFAGPLTDWPTTNRKLLLIVPV